MKMLISNRGNLKLKNSKDGDYVFLKFNLPSQITCPFKTEICSKICYAKTKENFNNVLNKRMDNYYQSLQPFFTETIIKELNYYIKKYENKKIYFRMHESGDFYSKDYVKKWLQVIKEFPNITFTAYTKSLLYFQDISIPNNFIVFYSVMPDTPKESIKEAVKIGLRIFEAIPEGTAPSYTSFACVGHCNDCFKCYDVNNKENIYIYYHGPLKNIWKA